MPKGYLIAEEQYLGRFSYASQADDSWGWMSRAYFCPECGEVWGRLIIESALTSKPQPFRPLTVACRRHYEPWGIPGSLLSGELRYNLDELEPDAIRREFEVHLSYFERML